MSTTFYIGVDPGQQGGLALIQGNRAVEYERMPDIPGIDDFFYNAIIMSQGKVVCIFEEQKGGRSSKEGGFTNDKAHKSAGRYEGIIETLCHVHRIPLHKGTSQQWKGMLGLIAKKGENAGKTYEEKRKAAKDRSIALAEQIFPNVNLLFPRCTKKADGPAEALLIAEWGRQRGL